MNRVIDLDKDYSEEHLTVGRLVGQGSFGSVTQTIWRGQNVAIKKFHGETKSFFSELNNLIRVNHDNIIKCLAFKQSENLIVMEYAENGSLHQLLHSPRYSNVSYNIAHALDWASQCAKGVQYLHSLKPKLIIHRDLKPLNILLKNNFTEIKICDFGTACHMKTIMTESQGSVSWMAPEVMKGSKYNEKCDVFSWGMILWELFSRKLPHFTNSDKSGHEQNEDKTKSSNCTTVGYSPFAVIWAITTGHRPKLLKNCPKALEELIVSCWSDNVKDRPSMADIVEKMNIFLDPVKNWAKVPIDQSKIVYEDPQTIYKYLTYVQKQNLNSFDKISLKNYIPDNVQLEPRCELVIGQSNSNDSTINTIQHVINYGPKLEDNSSNKTLEDKLQFLHLEKAKFPSNSNLNYISTVETQISDSNENYNLLLNDIETNGLTKGCGIGSLSKIVTDYFKPIGHSRFYIQEIRYTETDEIESQTLKPKKNSLISNNQPVKINNLECTKIITKHKTKNHRSEIEINNSKQLNSSASSTISSSSISLEVDEKKNPSLLNIKNQNSCNEQYFNTYQTNKNSNESVNNIDDFKLSNSFENINEETLSRELIDNKEYKFGSLKKKGGYIQNLKKFLKGRKLDEFLQQPSN